MCVVKAILPLVLVGAGLWLMGEALTYYGLQREHLAIGDPSGAEFYELNVKLYGPPGLIVFFAGGFLAGRWWFQR